MFIAPDSVNTPAERRSSPTPAGRGRRDELLTFCPFVRGRPGRVFRDLPLSEREEAVTADVAIELARLDGRGRLRKLVKPLADFGVRRSRAGGQVGTPTNRRDALSPVPRTRHKVVSLGAATPGRSVSWRDTLPDSRRADQAAIARARIDVEAWLSSLPSRLRQVAESLGAGERPGELAVRLGLSSGRLSQLCRTQGPLGRLRWLAGRPRSPHDVDRSPPTVHASHVASEGETASSRPQMPSP